MRLFWKRKRATEQPSVDAAGLDLLARLEHSGVKLVRVMGPKDGSCACGDWLGAVLSVSGEDLEFPAIVDAVEDGLFHPGCRHHPVGYNPDRISEPGRAKAMACTAYAIAAMDRRKEIRNNGLNAATPRQRFEALYAGARQADQTGDAIGALIKCKAALDLLRKEKAYDAENAQALARTLKARIRDIEKTQDRL